MEREPNTGNLRNAKPQLGTDESGAELGLGAPGRPVGWYSRGYLPHLNTPGLLQSVTFRLADSLPQSKLASLDDELSRMEPARASVEKRKRIEAWLDSGMGCRALAHPQVAAVVQETMLRWDGDRYRLIAWCVMPNHVHALLEPRESLPVILQSWKSFTGRWALARNAELGLGVPGRRFWMRETWDRYIRDECHFASVVTYIEANPVAAGLCGRPEDWRWSSASSKTDTA